MSTKGATVEAIEEVYRLRGTDFFRLVLARVSDPDLARDAVQEGFARAIRARGTFRGSGSLEAWICRCVLNAARGSLVDAARRELAEIVPANGAVVAADADVRAAIRRLPARQRDVLFLRFYLELDYMAIAEVLGIEVGTVSATLHAARKTLAQSLEEVAG